MGLPHSVLKFFQTRIVAAFGIRDQAFVGGEFGIDIGGACTVSQLQVDAAEILVEILQMPCFQRRI